jgi:DNA-binding transcriptional regulator YbjK
VLAEQGSRGLTHQRVDRAAGVPDGTTSYYYRTREALLRGVGQRVADIDLANIASVTAESTRTESAFGRLAQLVVEQAGGQGLLLNKARLELMLAAVRDPELTDRATVLAARGVALTLEAIDAVAPRSDDPELREAQSVAVMTFISGLFTNFAAGDRTLADAERLERLFHAIVTAVTLERAD